MVNKVLIYCDATQKIGRGHLTRCLALSSLLREQNFQSILVFRELEKEFEAEIEKERITYFKCKNKNKFLFFLKDIISQVCPKVFVFDSKNNISTYLNDFLKEEKILTVSIDTQSKFSKKSDLCFFPPHTILKREQFNGRVFIGLEYTLIRKTFYSRDAKKQVTGEKGNKIVIMMGGTDAHSLTYKLSVALCKNIECLDEIRVFLPEKNAQVQKLKSLSPKIKVKSNVKNMAVELDDIHLSIIHFGTTAYEMILLGIPAIHLCSSKDDLKSSLWFQEKKYAKTVRSQDLQDIDSSFFPKNFEIPTLKECKVAIEINRYLKHLNTLN